MERSVNVNTMPVSNDTSAADGPVGRFPGDHPIARSAPADLGPCLYLGPAGQRCAERAVEGGYCAKHQPGAAASIRSSSKVVAASVGILGILWPYVVDLVREIIRLLHSQ